MGLKKAVYAGTFDPFTTGHLDIVQRAQNLFDELTILVAVSPTKIPFLSQEKRVKILKQQFKKDKNILVKPWDGLVVDYAKKNNIDAIVRGLRPTGDFEIEFQMASMNRKINPEVETVFLMTSEKLYYISSSLVKEIYQHGGDISPFVTPLVLAELKKIKKK